MNPETIEQAHSLVLRPSGRLGSEQSAILVQQIKHAAAGVELDLGAVELIEVSMLQVILVTVASLKRRGLPVVISDNEVGVLRSTLQLAGIRPELAGLSPRLAL